MFSLHRKETRLARAFKDGAPRPNQSTGRARGRRARSAGAPLFLLNVQNGKTKGPFILHGGHPWTVRPAHHHHTCDGSSDQGGRVIRASEPRAAHDTQAVRRTQRTCVTWPGPGCTCACKSERRRLVDTPNFVAGGSH